jgi:hypothetical protein
VLPGGCRLIAQPGAVLRIQGSTQLVYLGAKKAQAYTVILTSGSLRATVPDGAPTAIVVAAPHQAVALIGKGEANIHAGDEVSVASAGGTTLLRKGDNPFRPLEPGFSAVFGRNQESRQAAVPPPSVLRGSTVLVSHGEPVSMGALSWEPVPRAAAYRVEILARAETRVPRLAAGIADLAPGGYGLRLYSIEANGMESPAPLARELRVIQMALPVGGRVDSSGAVRVPPRGSVSLSHIEDIEVTYGGGRYFVPAPASLEFVDAEPRLVRFRAVGETDELRIWLLPRDDRARIEFEPKAPIWPGEPLKIRVRMSNSNGSGAASGVEPRPKVTVGIEPVQVEFARQGEWLCGTVPARLGGGPWVVRVEVEDQHGIDLGRDFVEVARTAPKHADTNGKARAQARAAANPEGS